MARTSTYTEQQDYAERIAEELVAEVFEEQPMPRAYRRALTLVLFRRAATKIHDAMMRAEYNLLSEAERFSKGVPVKLARESRLLNAARRLVQVAREGRRFGEEVERLADVVKTYEPPHEHSFGDNGRLRCSCGMTAEEYAGYHY